MTLTPENTSTFEASLRHLLTLQDQDPAADRLEAVDCALPVDRVELAGVALTLCNAFQSDHGAIDHRHRPLVPDARTSIENHLASAGGRMVMHGKRLRCMQADEYKAHASLLVEDAGIDRLALDWSEPASLATGLLEIPLSDEPGMRGHETRSKLLQLRRGRFIVMLPVAVLCPGTPCIGKIL